MLTADVHDHALTEAERERLRTEGYVTRDRFFPEEEVARIEALADRAVAFHEGRPGHMAHVTREGRITFVNQLGDDSDVSRELSAEARSPRIARAARAIVGPSAAHYCYQIVYKHPNNPEPFCWHQDYIHTPSVPGFFNMWLALCDMSLDNGCLRVMPRVGLDQVLPYHETPYGHSCWPLDDPEQGVPIEMRRGSVLLVTSRTLHMSGPNRTDRIRKAILFAFMEGRDRVREPLSLAPYGEAA